MALRSDNSQRFDGSGVLVTWAFFEPAGAARSFDKERGKHYNNHVGLWVAKAYGIQPSLVKTAASHVPYPASSLYWPQGRKGYPSWVMQK